LDPRDGDQEGLEDPLYFYTGWSYRKAALDLLSEWFPDAAEGFHKAEEMFKNNLYVAVALNPGATVCGLAGALRMNPLVFFMLNIGSTAAQLLAMRAICCKFPNHVDYVLEIISTNVKIILVICLVVTLYGILPLLRGTKKSEEVKI
jgi:membrane protein DedA with SNARE-associated domain